MSRPRRWGRRVFLVSAAVIGGGLAVGSFFVNHKLNQQRAYRLPAENGGQSFGAWIHIDPQGKVRVAVPHQDMGQGILSAAAMIAAEELDLPAAQVEGFQAPISAVFANPVMLLDGLPFAPHDQGALKSSVKWTMERILRVIGIQATGGSTSTRNIYQSVRQAAADAKASIVSAAAKSLGVTPDKVTWAGSQLSANGRMIALETVLQTAATHPVVGTPKPAELWRYIGKEGFPRADVPAKTDGSLRFGIDVREPGQLYAAIMHAPQFGSTLASVEFAPNQPGVAATVQDKGFIAVVAKTYYQAKQALTAAKPVWTPSKQGDFNDATIFAAQDAAIKKAVDQGEGARIFEADGDTTAALRGAGKKLEAVYKVPYLAHATMEPMNCTVRYTDKKMWIWSGNQAPTLVKWIGAQTAGLDAESVEVITLPMGGGFGRRAEMDVIREAVIIAKAHPGVAVQTIWSREEDMQHDVYRPSATALFRAALGAQGLPLAWENYIASPSVTAQYTERLGPMYKSQLPDKTNVEGASWLPYGFGARKIAHCLVESPVPVGFWRSVGHSFNAFFVESFVDECAAAAGEDPLAYRIKLLKANPSHPLASRFIRLLETVAKSAGWPKAPSRQGYKTGLGIAVAESFGSIVAMVVEAQVAEEGSFTVPKVYAAVDCGLCIDPVTTRAQIRSAAYYGLSAALYGQIQIEGSRVQQSNFTNYRTVTLADAPDINVEILQSSAPMGGIGEVGLPPLAPALANALFAATGKRQRSLPFSAAV